jgi:HemY protein
LSLSVLGLQDAGLRRNAFRALAVLAEQRSDAQGALEALQQAAKI